VFDWLTGDDDQISVPDKSAPDRTLSLTQAQLGVLAAAFLVVLPILLAATGALIRWRRRRR
jgi:ABC-type uncharacterized transport system involved in gliding motility auxiliary subunit